MKACAVLLWLALSALTSPALALTWIEFRPAGAGYSVELPGEWRPSTQDVPSAFGPLKARRAAVTVGRRTFITMSIVYPEAALRAQPADTMLDGTRDGLVANVKGKLRSEQRLTVNDLPAREIVIDAPNNLVVVARYMLLRNVMVQALLAGQRGIESEKDTRYFLDSLKVAGE